MQALILCLALASPVFKWETIPSTPSQVALFQDGKQVGLFDFKRGVYYPLVNDKWLPPDTPPIQPPTPPEAYRKRCDNYGVDTDRISPKKSWKKNGKEITREDALKEFEKNVPDDRNLLRLTVIGPEPDRKRVLDDLRSSPALSAWKGKLLVQDYDPNAWAVSGVGFKTDGKPTIYVQQPDGKVLHRQDVYNGPDELATALRKIDPRYKPDADPNLSKPDLIPNDLKKYLPYALVGIAVYFLFFRSKK